MTDKNIGKSNLWEEFLDKFGGEPVTPYDGLDSYMTPAELRKCYEIETENLKLYIKNLKESKNKSKKNKK